ncbi:hypothetical protein NDU88_001910 [Pleurodeles waltl]|uniref:Uncharacterized protein n=1 Tax=Pleurodeles waltl TaxID=8319 RepID=A0AAV7UU20_PLEWA|nr:hypothetical protein NDU88_001910 [Pleurodeles waltl]
MVPVGGYGHANDQDGNLAVKLRQQLPIRYKGRSNSYIQYHPDGDAEEAMQIVVPDLASQQGGTTIGSPCMGDTTHIIGA